MAIETPNEWLGYVARTDPGRVCLVSDEEVLTYGEVLEFVEARAGEITASINEHEIVLVKVEIDVRSIIELLAIQVAGGVPLPYIGEPPELPVATAEGAAVCVETSGTGGLRKIVPLSYANIAASVTASRQRLGNGADDRWLLSLPLNHVGGLSILWRSLEAGGAVIVSPFDSSGGPIERHRPTYASMVPTMVHRLLQRNPDALASIGAVLVGGASLSSRLWSEADGAGVHLVPTYGMTETGSQIATLPARDERRELGLVGRPLDGFSVTIVDPAGADVAALTTGRIAVEGPAVFHSYLGEAERSKPFVTSDLGRLSITGDLYIEGRRDDVVVSGGENVSTVHVADALAGIDGVSDVCVVSIDDSEWGSIVVAMVVADRRIDSSTTMVATLLDRQVRPKRWIMTDEIPKLHNGKHDVEAVRAAFDSG